MRWAWASFDPCLIHMMREVNRSKGMQNLTHDFRQVHDKNRG